MIAGLISNAVLNPYWNVPPDLVRTRVAHSVNTAGIGYLKAGGYQALSDWSDTPKVLDPRTIDWKAVEAGTRELRVQLPSRHPADPSRGEKCLRCRASTSTST